MLLDFQAVALAADAQIDEGWEMRCWVCQGFVAEVGRSQRFLRV